ncbi:MAG: phosphomethylpyrimidine synthase ThiC, partial [Gemmatimonadales bacterium]
MSASTLPVRPPAPPSDFGEAFPNSSKVYLEGSRGIRVPMREIALSGGEPPLRVYDSSGPQGHDVRQGLPAPRENWILERDVSRVG